MKRRRLGPATLVPLVALCLAGCVEVDEEIRFDADGSGSGTYVLRIAWDADVVQGVVGTVDRRALERVAKGAPPLDDEGAWRDSLAGLPGLRLAAYERSLRVDGWQALRVAVEFTKLRNLTGWELFGRRAVSLGLRRPEGRPPRKDDVARRDDRVELVMDPYARVPLLDVLADAARLRRGEGGAPRAAEALGIQRERLEVLAEVLERRLEEVRLRVLVVVPGEIRRAAGASTRGAREATFELRFGDLVRGRDRRVRVTWSPRDFDRVATFAHAGTTRDGP